MDLMQFLPFLQADGRVKHAVESITKQPIDHVMKCLGSFIDSINKGPGLVNKAAEQANVFQKMYSAGISCGFKDYESIIAAAGFSGHSPIDVVTYLRETFGWDNVSVEEVEMLAKNIAPRFKQKLIQYGYLKEDSVEQKAGIPKVTIKNLNRGSTPPWRTEKSESSIELPKDESCK